LENDNDEFIQKVADFVNKEKVDFWKELSPAEQQEIKQAIKELNQGKRVSYDSFLRRIS
jgi:TRAP-type C4-dicarboxylate transport system substrate-binding protein